MSVFRLPWTLSMMSEGSTHISSSDNFSKFKKLFLMFLFWVNLYALTDKTIISMREIAVRLCTKIHSLIILNSLLNFYFLFSSNVSCSLFNAPYFSSNCDFSSQLIILLLWQLLTVLNVPDLTLNIQKQVDFHTFSLCLQQQQSLHKLKLYLKFLNTRKKK